MWREFHRLPEKGVSEELAEQIRKENGKDDVSLSTVLALATFLRGDIREAAKAIEPFMPQDGRVAIDTAIQTRNSAEQLEMASKIKHAMEGEPEQDMFGILGALSQTSAFKDSGSAETLANAAQTHKKMQTEMERMQGLMERIQEGDTSALMMELLGSSMPGMENMATMMNMMRMMNGAGNTE